MEISGYLKTLDFQDHLRLSLISKDIIEERHNIIDEACYIIYKMRDYRHKMNDNDVRNAQQNKQFTQLKFQHK